MTLAQSRCHELTVTDIYIYIQTHGDSSTAITCLAFRLGNKVVQYHEIVPTGNATTIFHALVT